MFKKIPPKISTIGIPRALYYYLYPALWETFFQQLGMLTVLSEPTTLRTVEHAGLISEAEHCLALKIFDAHLSQLASKVDAVFVPRILSTCRGHISCPKLGALPDAARAGILEGTEVITIEIDESKCTISKTLLALGRILGMNNSKNAFAVEAALGAMRIAQEELIHDQEKCEGPLLLVLGHPYILGDEFISGQITRKLKRLGVTVDWLSYTQHDIPETIFKWDMCSKMYQKISGLRNRSYAGVIQISSFNCGCDSILMEFIRAKLKEKSIAYMVLVLDEHSSSGWLDTRLEAFCESLRWHYGSYSNSHDG